MTERFSFRVASYAAVAVLLISAASTSIAAEEGVDPLPSDIEVSYSEIDSMIADMQGALASAESALDEVGIMKNPKESKAMVDGFFQQMKDKVNVMLDRLGPNSVLMDNLEGAKANLIPTQAKRNLSSRSGIGGVLSAT